MITQPVPSPMASLWLLPAPADEALLLGEIGRLADRHGTPRFHPHLTLLGDLPHDPATLEAQTRQIARAAPAFTAAVADIVSGEAFYRSFYAAFAPGPELAGLRTAAEQLFPAQAGPFLPHVSLLYGAVEAAAKADSQRAVAARLAGRPIRFDRLALTNSANDVPIAQWQVMSVVALPPPG